jgi:acylpyruvate hydrolase
MRFATVTSQAGTTAALLDGDAWRALPAADVSALLAQGSLEQAAQQAGDQLPGAVPVLALPTPHKVICCGLNYRDHILETGRELPEYPTLFAKFADTLTGPSDDIAIAGGVNADWEAELAVVVGAPLRAADREAAMAGIAGYTVANDVSIRDWQYRTLQWLQGKAWDATTPLGPLLVTPEELDPFAGVEVICRINGDEVQRGDTSMLVFDCADLLSYASTFTLLRPGDIVLTGTPGGVGSAREPQWFLADGDIMETEITGIGTLLNTIRIGA